MTTRTGRRRGFALMLVMLEVALIAGLWGIAHRQLVATMRFLTAMNQQGQTQINASQNADAYKPMAQALSLLETGDPPSNPYVCNATILTGSGPAYFLVTFYRPTDDVASGSTNNEAWTVTSVQQAVDSSELAGWNANLMPSSFSSN